MVETTYVQHSRPVNLRGWSFQVQISDEQVAQMVGEALQNSLGKDCVYASFPFMWTNGDGIGGPSPATPDTIHIDLPFLGDGGDDGPVFSVRLKDLVEDFIEMHVSDDRLDPDQVDKFAAFAASIMESLNLVETALRTASSPDE